jgi:KDO2-lipid IV(A) lauroyltransferase
MAETTKRASARARRWKPVAAAAIAVIGSGALVKLVKRLHPRLSSPLAGGMAKYYAFRAAAAVVPRLPTALVDRAAALAGGIFYLAAPALRMRAERNLRYVPQLAANPLALRRAVRGVFHYAALNYRDFLRDAHRSDEEIHAAMFIENEEALHALVAEGHGLVMFVPHSSAFELAAARLAVMGYEVVIPVERIEPPALFEFFRRSRERLGVRFLPADSRETLHEMMRVLRGGGVLVLAVDRLITGAGITLPFFGAPAKMPSTPASLALRMGARVGAAFPYHVSQEKAYALFVPLTLDEWPKLAEPGATAQPADHTGKATEEADAARLQRRFLAELERFLMAHPEQWVSALATVWEDA